LIDEEVVQRPVADRHLPPQQREAGWIVSPRLHLTARQDFGMTLDQGLQRGLQRLAEEAGTERPGGESADLAPVQREDLVRLLTHALAACSRRLI